jgi:hypothetical protein
MMAHPRVWVEEVSPEEAGSNEPETEEEPQK